MPRQADLVLTSFNIPCYPLAVFPRLWRALLDGEVDCEVVNAREAVPERAVPFANECPSLEEFFRATPGRIQESVPGFDAPSPASLAGSTFQFSLRSSSAYAIGRPFRDQEKLQ